MLTSEDNGRGRERQRKKKNLSETDGEATACSGKATGEKREGSSNEDPGPLERLPERRGGIVPTATGAATSCSNGRVVFFSCGENERAATRSLAAGFPSPVLLLRFQKKGGGKLLLEGLFWWLDGPQTQNAP